MLSMTLAKKGLHAVHKLEQKTVSCHTPFQIFRRHKFYPKLCHAAVNQRQQRQFASSSYHPNGLFSIPELQKPPDFMKLAAQAIETCNSIRQDLKQSLEETITSKHQAQERLFQLDHISKNVCNVIDAAELCRSVHVSEEWREAANRAFGHMSSYIGELNADTTLYQILIHVISCKMELTEEETRFCRLLKAEFERDGIHLPDALRERAQELQQHVTQLETLFSQNLVHRQKQFSIQTEQLLGVFPRQFLSAHGIPEDANELLIGTDSDVATSLLKFSSNADTRKQVYREIMTACPENLQVLDSLIQMRQRVSLALGFPSYADRFLKDKMAGSPKHVFQFLNTLLRSNRPHFHREMTLLADAKGKLEGVSQIEPWDVSFYTGILKARNGFDSSSMSSYFTLDQCINGIKLLVDSLFGITMTEKPMTPDEAWDIKNEDNNQKTSLRRLDFVDSQGGSVGTIYLDLVKRDGKYGHAAHFTVRCGCQQEFNNPNNFQKPIIALVCNLSNLSSSNSNGLLTHTEVETIFHEMGHMLHSMLSRTKFQHMSGTRAPMDFVETPSHWMEQYVWDPEFLKLMARHHTTGQVIPDDMIRRLRQSRHEFHALERQNQIVYALFDQTIFGVNTTNTSKIDTTEIFRNLHRQQGIPYADGTHWHSRFGHLVSYGAGYYGYLYSQVFANDIWRTWFEGNSLNRTAGMKLRETVLVHGGSRDPNRMLEDLLGRRPHVDVDQDC